MQFAIYTSVGTVVKPSEPLVSDLTYLYRVMLRIQLFSHLLKLCGVIGPTSFLSESTIDTSRTHGHILNVQKFYIVEC
jgi:hypothetical protein